MRDPRWEELAETFDAELCDVMRRTLDSHGDLHLTAIQIAGAANTTRQEAERLLEALGELGVLGRRNMSETTCHECGRVIQRRDLVADECPACHRLIDLDSLKWRARKVYVRQAARGRDVPWVLVVHGMNTSGKWQEELSWRIATTYGRSVPVYIYKYGKVQLGAVVRWRQKQLVDSLALTLREIAGEGEEAHLGPRPDVIAHSFGTWLIGHVLKRHGDIRLGRVILVGGVVRPDFPWQSLIDARRVEAVLNHYGGRDRWVPLAAWTIPDAGPTGRRSLPGGPRVVNREELGYGHSSFFRDQLENAHQSVWEPFLRQPAEGLAELSDASTPLRWKPPARLVAMALRFALVGVMIGAGALLLVALVLGAQELWRAI